MPRPHLQYHATGTLFQNGNGMACARSFRVINQRKPLVVYFFANATQANGFFSAATLAAQTAPLPFSNYNEPTQVHLALTQKTGCGLQAD